MKLWCRTTVLILVLLLGWRACIDWRIDQMPAGSSKIDLLTAIDLKKASITVTNSGRENTEVTFASVRIGAIQTPLIFPRSLPIGKSETVEFSLPAEMVAAREPLYTEIQYSDSGITRTLLNVTAPPRPVGTIEVAVSCPQQVLDITSSATLSVPHPDDIGAEFIIPGGFSHLPAVNLPGETRFPIKNLSKHRGINSSSYVIFRSLQPAQSPPPAPKLCPVQLNAQPIPGSPRVLIIPWYYLAFIAFNGLFFATLLYRISCRRKVLTPWRVALIRWSFSIFIVGALFTLHALLPILARTAYWYLSGWSQTAAPRIAGVSAVLLPVVDWFRFDGANYDYFNDLIAQPLWVYMLTFNLLFIRYVIRPDPNTDKYWHLLMKTIGIIPGHSHLSLPGSPAPSNAQWRLAKIALLALAVKVFYFPVFSSWTIRNTVHLQQLFSTLTFHFEPVNRLIVDSLIFIDVLVFTLSYITEAPQLKNQIKSVEPTLVGWLYCIICYPPLNTWAYHSLDVPLIGQWPVATGAAHTAVLVTITVLWLIYVWATIALGTRASNLTNRGIVESGPYRYIRHPAYVSKLLVWTLSGLFLGTYNFFLVLFFWYVYTVRAWTEERHLSADPDYVEYRKRVKWWYCPRIF